MGVTLKTILATLPKVCPLNKQLDQFRSIEHYLNHLADVTVVWEGTVGMYVQFTIAMNFQKLHDICMNAYASAYSIEMDGATNRGYAYVDIRIHVCVVSEIEKIHVLAI